MKRSPVRATTTGSSWTRKATTAAVPALIVLLLVPALAGAAIFKSPVNGNCKATAHSYVYQSAPDPTATHSYLMAWSETQAGWLQYCSYILADVTVQLLGSNYPYQAFAYAPPSNAQYFARAPSPSGNAFGVPFHFSTLICQGSTCWNDGILA